MSENQPAQNPAIVFREETSDWAILFNPQNGCTFGLDPVGVLMWRNIDGVKTLSDHVSAVRHACEGVSTNVAADVLSFLADLRDNGLVI